jgi:hypothetical protein
MHPSYSHACLCRYETLDSLIPFLGSDGALHAAVTVVDVERGEGLFAQEVASKCVVLVKCPKSLTNCLGEKSVSPQIHC